MNSSSNGRPASTFQRKHSILRQLWMLENPFMDQNKTCLPAVSTCRSQLCALGRKERRICVPHHTASQEDLERLEWNNLFRLLGNVAAWAEGFSGHLSVALPHDGLHTSPQGSKFLTQIIKFILPWEETGSHQPGRENYL